MSAEESTRQFIALIVNAAISDANAGMPERDRQNSGAEIVSRLNLPRRRISPRIGDRRFARMVYTAARFVYRTECEDAQ